MNDKTLNEQIFASIMHGCPELSKGALGQNAQLPNQSLHFQRCTHGFIEYCLLREDTNSRAYWAPSAPYAQCLGLRYNLIALIMHGCPELSKGALGQNAQLPNQSLHFPRCAHGFIKYCLLREDTNSHIGPLQLPMLNVWVCVII